MTTTCSHQKKIQFSEQNQVQEFEVDDDEESDDGQRRDSQDLYSAHGLIRVYAGIWDLEVTYKGTDRHFYFGHVCGHIP